MPIFDFDNHTYVVSSLYARRCHGNYHLEIYQQGSEPRWIRSCDSMENCYYGVISGISPDKIAYATQASEAAFIVNDHNDDETQCEVLPANFKHSDDKLYVAFDSQCMKEFVPGTKKQVYVEFEVKHLFFNNLIDAVNSVSSHTVSRIVPTKELFLPVSVLLPEESNIVDELVPGKEDEHKKILTQVVQCPASSPPVLIKGAFGTGKTRLLALIARFYVILGRKKNCNVRVLIVAHHQATADILLKNFCKLLPKAEKFLGVIRVTSLRYRYNPPHNSELPKSLFKKCYDIMKICRENKHNTIEVIVSTFQTALHLKNILIKSKLSHLVPNFFTHILIDEGAQGWEPEAVAPLCFAFQNTKIVVVGDTRQV